MAPRAYNDPDYRAAKAQLEANPQPCTCPGCPRCSTPQRCTRTATTPDHRPALVDHNHRRGTGCCILAPACDPCNTSTGATAGNTARNNNRDTTLHTHAARWRG